MKLNGLINPLMGWRLLLVLSSLALMLPIYIFALYIALYGSPASLSETLIWAALLVALPVAAIFLTVWRCEKIFLAPVRQLLDRAISMDPKACHQARSGSGSNELADLSRAMERIADILAERGEQLDASTHALRLAHHRLVTAQRIGNIGNWDFDIASNQVWWSDQTYAIYGVTPDPLVSSAGRYEGVLKHVLPQDRERYEAAQKEFFAGRGKLDIEHRIVKPGGEVRWVHGLGECFLDDQARPAALSGTVQDITDRKLADAALWASEAQFRRLTDAMPQIVWTMQPDGTYTYFNQNCLDYTGLHGEERRINSWTGLIHPDDRLHASGLWEPTLVGGQIVDVECRVRRADGLYRWMLGRTVPQYDEAGQVFQWLGTFTDIDEIKKTTEQLKKNLAMTRIAGRVARLGGWTIDLPERILTWSDENCVIHDVQPGYKPTLEEGISYFLPQNRAEVMRYVLACAEHGTPYEFVLPKHTATGRRIWVRSTGEAVRDNAGKIIRLQGAFQDITVQKRAEDRMHALEAQLTTTLESITDGFYILGKDWKFLFVNIPAERMLKRRREDLLGKSMWQEFPEALGTSIEKHCHLTVNEQRTARFEIFYEPLDTWFDFHVYPTEAGLAVYFQDVTQRRQEQAQLRLLQKAVSRLNDIVVIMEAEHQDESGPRIVFVNDAFECQTGYSRENVIGRTPGLVWAPKSQQSEVERIRVAMKNWQPVRAEVAIYTKSGQALWLEIDVAPIVDESGRFTHWVAVSRGILERRMQRQEILRLNNELEDRVRQRTAQLATANKELESFAYAVSHDLRSPLNTVDAFSQLLLKLDAENISDKGKHYLDRIGVGVRHMGELIEGLLTLAHLSRGAIRSEPVDLSVLAWRIDNQCRAREPGRELKMHIQDGLCARGDARLLLAVFQNLIDNAWKFTSRQPHARIDVGCEPGAAGEVVFFVRDNGAGFDMAHAHKLFGTFERLHSPGEFPGTGIGLATVKRVIERHGGRVWARSQLNEGATFYFTLSPTAEACA